MPEPPLIGRLDVEAAFLLAIPLIDLPSGLTGVCRLSVEIQGGSISVQSEYGRGSVFTVVLPRTANREAILDPQIDAD